MQVEFHREIFNEVYLPHLRDTNRFNVFYGGAGSGKSIFAAQRYLTRCLGAKYFRLIFCRKVGKTIRNSQFLLFKDLISQYGLSDLFQLKESNMEIICANGNQMMSAGLDDREKIKSIQEPTDIWMEEATEFSREDFLQLNLRLRTRKAPNQITLSFNPISQNNWVYDDFFVNKSYKGTILKTTYLDNQFLPTEFKEQMDDLKRADENYYKIYALGEWGGIVKGAIWPHWKMAEQQEGDTIYGLDFGFNNPTAMVRIKIKENDLFVHQMIYRTKLTNSDLINELRGLSIGSAPIYADAAEPQRIEEIYRAGFNIKPCHKEKDSVKKGIDKIRSMGLYITAESSDLIKEIRAYKWAEDRNGNILDEPVKFLDHLCDATRYAVHTHLTKPSGKYSVA